MNINFNNISPSFIMWLLLLLLISSISYIVYKFVKSIKWWKETKGWLKTIKPGDKVLVPNLLSESHREGVFYKDNNDGTVEVIVTVHKELLYKPYSTSPTKTSTSLSSQGGYTPTKDTTSSIPPSDSGS